MIDWSSPTSLRGLRRKHGIDVAALASRSGVSVATIYRIEQGKFDPRLKTQRALNVAIAALMGSVRAPAEAAA